MANFHEGIKLINIKVEDTRTLKELVEARRLIVWEEANKSQDRLLFEEAQRLRDLWFKIDRLEFAIE